MKKYLIAFCLLVVFAIVSAEPIKLPLKSRFDQMDKTDAGHEVNKTAVCVKILHNIRHNTFISASLQQSIDADAALQKPANQKELDKLKSLNERIQFENDEYAKNCI